MIDPQEISSDALALSIANAHKFADKILEKKTTLLKVLSEYQSTEVTIDEIERSVDTLRNIESLSPNFTHSVGKIAAYFPSNLPLYSLVLFAAVPSIMAQEVNIRPNQIMQDMGIFEKLRDVLDLDEFFPNVHIRSENRVEFNKRYLPKSDAAIFTGTPANGRKLLADMKEGALLVLNGAGHNPIVVTETADIDKAVRGAVYTKGFNCGQDCAGADAILVHSSVAPEFIERFVRGFTALRKGDYTNPEVRIGPITRLSELMKFGKIFHEDRDFIVAGGNIDFKNGIVDPTVMKSRVLEKRNYKEMFGPVAYIHIYDSDKDLAHYFEDANGEYVANKMYVSVYGNSKYLAERDDSKLPDRNGVGIIIHNQTIHDVEQGNQPYGGYASNASSVMMLKDKGVICEAKPILIPEVIHQHLVQQIPLQERSTSKRPRIDAEDHIVSTVEEFKKIAQEVFGENLAFAFVFGSVAKNQQTFNLAKRSDLDTFICLKDDVPQKMKDEYIKRIISLQKLKGFAYDAKYPAEIVTLKHLKDVVSNLDNVKPKLSEISSDATYDAVIWTQVLNDAKRGFIGDGRLMSSLIKQTGGHLERWRSEIIGQLESGVKLADGSSVDIENLRSAPIYSVLKSCLRYQDKSMGVKI